MMLSEEHGQETRMSGLDGARKSFDSQGFVPESIGQSYPQQNPHPENVLGEPLSIRDVAKVIGCSDWTVRYRYLPQGLPHFRSGPAGKFVFYRKQVIAWILQQQRKGGR